MNPPDFTLDKIKFATDGPTFEKAVVLYESGKVTKVEEGIRSYTGVVIGTKPYRVSVEARRYDLSRRLPHLCDMSKLTLVHLVLGLLIKIRFSKAAIDYLLLFPVCR